MIPNRLLLRALTVLALKRGEEPPFPTIAGGTVFDTQLRPIVDVAQETMLPAIMVYTDTDKRVSLDRNSMSRWTRTVSLIIELAITSVKPGKGPQRLEWAETDAELEALLDLLELQVEHTLQDPLNPWAIAWKKSILELKSWESEPYRSSEQGQRYAVRQIFLDCEIPADTNPSCLPIADPKARVLTIENELKQIPWLVDLAEAIESEAVFASLAKLLTTPDVVRAPALRTVGIRSPVADAIIKMQGPT